MTVIDHEELRRGVREVCAAFPDAYWRELEQTHSYPEAFVDALTTTGVLGALVGGGHGRRSHGAQAYGGRLPAAWRTSGRVVRSRFPPLLRPR